MRLIPSQLGSLPRWLAQISFALLLLTFSVKAQQMTANNADRDAIRAVIQQQLQAFQKDDAEEAFTFASPEIRTKFGTAKNFFQAVKTSYAAVYRPRSVMFEKLVTVQGIPTQEVVLLAPNGDLVKALYLMEKQPDNTWKISGCFIVPVQGQTI
jgi:ketosteroid isomerase-like protein